MSPNYIRLANFLNLSLKSEPSEITFFSDLVEAIGLDALPLCSFISFFLAPKDSPSVEYTNLTSLRFDALSN